MKPKHALILSASLLVAFTPRLRAANNWTNSAGGLWESANWSLGTVPGASDTVNIGTGGIYTVTLGSSAVNTFPTTLTNSGLNVYNIYNVNSGTPTLTLNYTNAATFQVNGKMNIGNGTVNVNLPNGGVNLGAYPNGLWMGDSAYGLNGTINVQSGNFNAGGFIILGSSVGSMSTINVSTGGSLTLAGGRIGYQGSGQVNINGGTLYPTHMIMGYVGGTTGRIVMTSGYLDLTGGNSLGVGGGDYDSANHGYGELIISNGSFYSASYYSVLDIGDGQNAAGGGGQGYMKVYGGNSTNVAQVFVGGGFNNNGANSTGVVLLAGGKWNAASPWWLGKGTNSYALLTVSNATYQAIANTGGINLGSGLDSRSELDLVSGQISLNTGTGAASDPWLEVGCTTNSTAKVHVTGGSMSILNGGPGLLIGTNTAGNASVILDGGVVQLARLNVGPSGVFSNRAGGVLQFVTADIVSGAGAKVVDGGTLSYKNYSASALTVSVAVAKFSIVSGSGLQLDTSTNSSITGTYVLTNAPNSFKDLSLTGGGPRWQSDSLLVDSSASLRVTNAVNAHVASVVTNLGLIRVDGSFVTWEKPLVLSGTYISDPSTNTFLTNVTVTASGTLAGGLGDLFDFKKSLIIQSTNNLGFNLASSVVSFSGGGSHTNTVTGGDYGTNLTVYPNANFSYGTMTLASATDQLYFVSGGFTNGLEGSNALYVTQLNLLTNGVLSSNLVTSLHSPFNIYYLDSLLNPGNAYLHDVTFQLSGGGELLPFVPEPSALMLLLVGGGAILARRRFLRSQ